MRFSIKLYQILRLFPDSQNSEISMKLMRFPTKNKNFVIFKIFYRFRFFNFEIFKKNSEFRFVCSLRFPRNFLNLDLYVHSDFQENHFFFNFRIRNFTTLLVIDDSFIESFLSLFLLYFAIFAGFCCQ